MERAASFDPPRGASGGVGLAAVCIRRPVFATMMNLLLVVLGWFSFHKIGIDQFPNVELPGVTVTTTLRGASPEEMETSVTKPLEEIINTIEGVDELSSITREGVSRITVRKAIDELVDDGLLVRKQGSGTYVSNRVEKNFAKLTSFSEDMRARGRAPRSIWLNRAAGTVTPEESLTLRSSPGTPVSSGGIRSW